MQAKNIALIGFMGSGKSMISKKLAPLLSKKLVSTDGLIEKKEGRLISKVFEEFGEDHFRRLEQDVLRQVAQEENILLDCGGGIPLNDANRSVLKSNFTVIYLKMSPELLYDRLKNAKNRPLLKVEDPKKRINELLAQREPYYSQADHMIDVDHLSINEICEKIEKVLL